MKKLLFIVMIFTILFLSIPTFGKGEQRDGAVDYQVIPDEAIRLRILANSDAEADQKIKRLVRDNVNEQITKWVAHITDINEARALLQTKIPEIKEIVEKTLQKKSISHKVNVSYGKKVTFPTKLYGSYLYPAGEYEAVLITIGAGEGANWWCVLFPPLCFLDFSNGTTVAAETDEKELIEPEEDEEEPVKVKFFLFEWLGLS
ncbi:MULTISPECIES: stage II sporulation protein R [unclassified Virgibacillus]|uniref:stage II sporulation protein R n=1 Tax=unclassified Virgibacillus TaxID=2620237 RepID=UPI0024DE4E02|nr:stage II sporulation protein R [Virgibacillus sp. LDC-1]